VIVEILAVGTELLLGQIVNTNAAEIGSRLADAGLAHYHQTVVGDNLERCAAAIRLSLGRSDAVVVTGGIGPTQDDITREAVCAATGREMLFDEGYARDLEGRWAALGREMPRTNLRQAEYPAGAELLANPKGTAPGLRLEVDGVWVFVLPGVPEEMIPMLEAHVLPFLVRASGGEAGVVHSRLLRTWGESESRIAALVDDLYAAQENPTMAFLASAGEIKVRLTARAATAEEAEALIAPVEAEVRNRLGGLVFGADADTVERVLLRAAGERGWSLGTAESATGGLVAARITGVPGASATFVGGIVAYDAVQKEHLLGVGADLMARHGIVSTETALAMAAGGAERIGADVVLAVTGSAGPDPQEQPPGTMVVAVRTPEDARARTLRLPGDRERVRTYTATAALHLGRLAITGTWWRS